MPERWSSADALNVAFYDELLHKGCAPYPTPSFTIPVPLEGLSRLLAQGPLPRVSMTAKQDKPAQLLGNELPLPAPLTLDTQQLLVANPLELARQSKLATPPPILEVQLVADQRTTTMFRIDTSPPVDE